ncbi:MAG TPA: electron transfer flavoprotein subunit alpha/FixB family protein [Solirubrobacteraceae bacterium]|nr:electron transfer flavoprotein subunit alpha/FixB family protein [Solirubrobacteraceae bacterium]
MVLTFVEHADGAPDALSLQALTLARGFADGEPVQAVMAGPGAAEAAPALGEYGVATVHVAELDGGYAPQAWARAVAELAGRIGPAAVVAAGSDRGNEILAHAAVMTGAALAANCVAATPGDPAGVTRVRWGGSLLEEARLHGALKLLTVAPHALAMEPAPAGETAIETFGPELRPEDLVVQVSERVDTSTGGLSLAEAPIVVSGGRGVGSAEGFGMLEELAGLLGGVVGCSRAVTSAGWRPHTDQVGQTGTKISPDLYIPCGISGATQHMAGCKGAKRILAINADPDAPILANADYAVVGDVGEIVPAITAELRRVREAS